MSVAAIVQARMTSTRLPGKVMADFGRQPMLGHMLNRLAKAKSISKICVATTTNPADDAIAEYSASLGLAVERGDEQNVLARFNQAAQALDKKTCIRLTADCPMTDPNMIDLMVKQYFSGGYDYFSNVVERFFPDGLDVEIFSKTLLEQAASEATEAYDQEHVTTYMRRLGSQSGSGVKMGHYKGPADFGHLRWTVDTQGDLDNIRQLVDKCPDGYSWLDALATLTKYPELMIAMTAGARLRA